MTELPYYTIPTAPNTTSATNSIARFVDGLGFRYRWATEDLTEKEIHFCPIEGSMSLLELIQHIYSISNWSNRSFGGTIKYDKTLTTFTELRKETLRLLLDLSSRLKEMEDGELENFEILSRNIDYRQPFWYMLNGPIADALTHVGQITSWRRISGNPQPKGVNVFLGTKS